MLNYTNKYFIWQVNFLSTKLVTFEDVRDTYLKRNPDKTIPNFLTSKLAEAFRKQQTLGEGEDYLKDNWMYDSEDDKDKPDSQRKKSYPVAQSLIDDIVDPTKYLADMEDPYSYHNNFAVSSGDPDDAEKGNDFYDGFVYYPKAPDLVKTIQPWEALNDRLKMRCTSESLWQTGNKQYCRARIKIGYKFLENNQALIGITVHEGRLNGDSFYSGRDKNPPDDHTGRYASTGNSNVKITTKITVNDQLATKTRTGFLISPLSTFRNNADSTNIPETYWTPVGYQHFLVDLINGKIDLNIKVSVTCSISSAALGEQQIPENGGSETIEPAWTAVGKGTITISQTGNTTFNVKGTPGAAGNNNPVKSWSLKYSIGSTSYNTTASTSTSGTNDNITNIAGTSTIVYAKNTTVGTYGNDAVYTTNETIYKYVAPVAPGTPALEETSFKNNRLTNRQNWTYSWPSATQTGHNKIEGYRIYIYKNGTTIKGLIANDQNSIITVGSGTNDYVDTIISAYRDAYGNRSITFNPKGDGFNFKPGDTIRIEVLALSHGYNNAVLNSSRVSSDTTKVAGGTVWVRVPTDTVGRAPAWVEGIVYIKTSDGWKEAEAVYVKTSGGWKESE